MRSLWFCVCVCAHQYAVFIFDNSISFCTSHCSFYLLAVRFCSVPYRPSAAYNSVCQSICRDWIWWIIVFDWKFVTDDVHFMQWWHHLFNVREFVTVECLFVGSNAKEMWKAWPTKCWLGLKQLQPSHCLCSGWKWYYTIKKSQSQNKK